MGEIEFDSAKGNITSDSIMYFCEGCHKMVEIAKKSLEEEIVKPGEEYFVNCERGHHSVLIFDTDGNYNLGLPTKVYYI